MRGGSIASSVGAVAAAVLLAAVAVNVAGATSPSGQTSAVLAKATTAETFKLTKPQEVTVTQKYKVKVRVKGKFVTRTKTRQVKRMVDTPFVSCSDTTTCDVIVQTITYQPGGFSGWHHHPGVVVAVVKSGQITRFRADCSKQTFTTGQSFVEMGDKDVVFVKNEGSTPTEIEATLIHPAGAAPRSDENAPANCNP
jgi:quercetin dioxygenase-like cupin family protein